MISKYWALEVELCRLSASLGMKKQELLDSASELPREVFFHAESILWEQADILKEYWKLRVVE